MTLVKCKKCGRYTLEIICPSCGEATISPYPPRFSPGDRYGVYRRKLKLESMGSG